jgi:hypothetical protein
LMFVAGIIDTGYWRCRPWPARPPVRSVRSSGGPSASANRR